MDIYFEREYQWVLGGMESVGGGQSIGGKRKGAAIDAAIIGHRW